VSPKRGWQRCRKWFCGKEFAGILVVTRFSTSVVPVTADSGTAAMGAAVYVVARSAGQRTVATNKAPKVVWIIGTVNVRTVEGIRKA